MRIWAFPSFYPYDAPGMRWTGIFAHRQYKGLVDVGANLQVIMPVLASPPFPIANLFPDWKRTRTLNLPLKRVYDGITIHHPRIQNWKPNRLMSKSYADRYTAAVASVFQREGIKVSPKTDVFYSQWLPESVQVQHAAHTLGLKSGILSIGDDVVVWPNENERNFNAFNKLLQEADYRFVCADYLGREQNKMINKNLSYQVVRWGVDYDYFKPASDEVKVAMRAKYGIPADKVAILNVGSSIVRKGWIDLMDALKEVKKTSPNFVLVAVHAGHHDIDLDALAKERGLENQFVNLAEVPPTQLSEVFNAVDVFCLPSHWEGLANANIEAMSSGLPVVTTDVCGHPELVKDGINGVLLPSKRPDILAEKLSRLIIDEPYRKQLSANGREYIVKEWGNFSDNAHALLKTLSAQ